MNGWEALGESLWDSVVDTASLVPFLFLTYLAMEALEHVGMGASERLVSKAGKAGPLVGALLGAVPQCGFSAMAATLYAVRVVSLGTLIAVMLSTSDEMLPVFVAQGAPISVIFQIIGFKAVVGLIAGFFVDLAVRVWKGPLRGAKEPAMTESSAIRELCRREGCHCEECLGVVVDPEAADGARVELGVKSSAHADRRGHSHAHVHADGDAQLNKGAVRGIFMAALVHTAQVTVFLFLVTWVLGLVLEGFGSEVIATYLVQNPSQAVIVAGLVGLVPNCAASVIVSELYLEGALGTGALMSGLLVGSGVTLLVLFRANRHPWQDVAIMVVVLAVGVIVGFLVNAAGLSFS